MSSRCLPTARAVQAMARIRCPSCGLPRGSSDGHTAGTPDSVFRPVVPHRAVLAQGSFAPEALPSFSATTSPCADPGASRLLFGLHLIGGVPAACTIHGWSPGPSRFGSALLCWSAAPLMPAVRRVRLTSSSPTTSAFAQFRSARLPAILLRTASRGLSISTRQAFANVTALQLACPPDRSVPHRGTRGRLARACCRFVASSAVECATRPTGRLPGLDFHQLERQPLSAAPEN